MTITQAEIIVELAKNNMNITTTAKSMFMHRNNITYHIRQIRRKTGMNPLDFFELNQLLPKAEAVLNQEE